MKITAIVITLIIGLISCKTDNFDVVTKKLTAPDRIELNTPFELNAVLINNTNKQLRLTLDKDITKSLFFLPNWYCDQERLIDKTPNPKDQLHDFYTTYLQPKDSISFTLTGQIMSFSNNDSLRFSIEGYEKDFRVVHPKCDNFKVNLEGMWIPGDGPLTDAMEGYGFKKEIEIK